MSWTWVAQMERGMCLNWHNVQVFAPAQLLFTSFGPPFGPVVPGTRRTVFLCHVNAWCEVRLWMRNHWHMSVQRGNRLLPFGDSCSPCAFRWRRDGQHAAEPWAKWQCEWDLSHIEHSEPLSAQQLAIMHSAIEDSHFSNSSMPDILMPWEMPALSMVFGDSEEPIIPRSQTGLGVRWTSADWECDRKATFEFTTKDNSFWTCHQFRAEENLPFARKWSALAAATEVGGRHFDQLPVIWCWCWHCSP